MAKRVLFAILLLFALENAAQAQNGQNAAESAGGDNMTDPMAARLSAERVSDVQPGAYDAGTKSFTIVRYGDKYLMRIAPRRECYVLYADRVALGGRILKYDTGATALKVSVWGGVTLYTRDAPGGVPAMRVGDSPPMPLPLVTLAQLTDALQDEARHLAYTAQYTLHFRADSNVLEGDDTAHALAFDTLVNTEAGIELLMSSAAGHHAMTRRIDTVQIVKGAKPTMRLSGKTLLVSFVPSRGLAGRASSRAVAYTLGRLLSVDQPT